MQLRLFKVRVGLLFACLEYFQIILKLYVDKNSQAMLKGVVVVFDALWRHHVLSCFELKSLQKKKKNVSWKTTQSSYFSRKLDVSKSCKEFCLCNTYLLLMSSHKNQEWLWATFLGNDQVYYDVLYGSELRSGPTSSIFKLHANW